MSLLQFIAFLSHEIVELYGYYTRGRIDEGEAALITMRMNRRISDEIALREIGK